MKIQKLKNEMYFSKIMIWKWVFQVKKNPEIFKFLNFQKQNMEINWKSHVSINKIPKKLGNWIFLFWKWEFSTKNLTNDPLTKIWSRWRCQLHCHMVLILNQNQTFVHQEYFACGTFSYQHCFVDKKLVQRRPRPKKSRCLWDGVYLRTSTTLRALPSDRP